MTLSRTSIAAFAALVSLVAASPCPYGQMFERGELSDKDAANFLAARSDGSAAVENMMDAHAAEKQKRDFENQEQFYKRQLDLGHLLMGGGLLNGVLQPFTGALEGLDLPTPQPIGVFLVPDAEHPFEYPTADAVRGMCPTLNTMANHGYINRNGITNFAQAANACQQTLGFGYDTCVVLSALGLIAGGDLPTGAYSIGGADSRVPNTLGPALGLSKHGVFEIDQSISRQDDYFGNQADFEMTRWNQLTDIASRHNNQFGMDMWAEERAITYQQSRDTNPNFNAEVKHFIVSLAERVFIFRALPNGTEETVADFANVAPFYLNETFPEEWFKRGSAYSVVNLATDILDLYLMGPTQIGRNEGLNNFIPLGLDISQFTVSNTLCFIETAVLDLAPGDISPTVAQSFDVVAAFLNGAVKPFFADAGCDDSTYTAPGPNAGNGTPGVSSGNILLNGVYQSTTPDAAPVEAPPS